MMSQDGLVNHELVSALADGQLAGDEFAGALTMLAESDEALAAWHAYHVVSDVLHSGDLADGRGDMAFVARLRGQLASPVESRLSVQPTAGMVAPFALDSDRPAPGFDTRESANDPVTRWKLVAGLASMVAVAAVGWHLASGDAGTGAQLAAVPGNASTATVSTAEAGAVGMAEPPVMLRDARLDELLAAHKQFGGTSALQMPAGFLRNATFENPGR